jgi:hypothetical protein
MSATFPKPLMTILGPIVKGERTVILTEEFSARTDIGTIRVPKGFVSDGASVPRSVYSIIGHPFGKYLESAIIHDYLYRDETEFDASRAEADSIFLELMKAQGIGFSKRWAMYLAVRSGGWLSFKKRRAMP